MSGDAEFFAPNGASRRGAAARVGEGRHVRRSFMLSVSPPFRPSVRQSPRGIFSTVVKHAESDPNNPGAVKIPGL